MGNTVTINGPGTITGQFDYTAPDGSVITFYGWTFSVTVNGQAGVYTVWIDSNSPDAEPNAAQDAIEDLQADPGELGPIAENDPGSDRGDYGDQGDYGDMSDQGDMGDQGGDMGDDDGDGSLAGDGGQEDVGVSV